VSDYKLHTLADGLLFPECPRWHDCRLFFSDMHAGIVTALAADGSGETIAAVAAGPAGLGWRPDGTLLIVSMQDRRLLTGRLDVVAELAAFAPFHCNDMIVDHLGRAYIGNFGFNLFAGAQPAPTCLLRVDPDGSVRAVADDLLFPNGMAITPDHKTLIVAQTFGHELTAFDVDDDGSLSCRRVFAALPGLWPDGICLDADGCIWVACPAAQKTILVREGGGIVTRISHPGRDSFACALGGEDGRTLFLCTAKSSRPDIVRATRSGRIEAVHLNLS
jgi:sugar lactone lactonase YvrE